MTRCLNFFNLQCSHTMIAYMQSASPGPCKKVSYTMEVEIIVTLNSNSCWFVMQCITNSTIRQHSGFFIKLQLAFINCSVFPLIQAQGIKMACCWLLTCCQCIICLQCLVLKFKGGSSCTSSFNSASGSSVTSCSISVSMSCFPGFFSE